MPPEVNEALQAGGTANGDNRSDAIKISAFELRVFPRLPEHVGLPGYWQRGRAFEEQIGGRLR
jgi:hypothetical protein